MGYGGDLPHMGVDPGAAGIRASSGAQRIHPGDPGSRMMRAEVGARWARKKRLLDR